jgi:phenylacetate-coenzyme A ligase PaaK-like adenylate-forming protein
MENMIVETHDTHGILVTDLTNPLITRYALGDVVELGQSCPCNRSLKTISKIHGRIRNMLVLQNNNKIWPTFGEPKFRTITNKIIRHQIVQKDLINITVFLQVTEPLTIMEQTNLLTLMQTTIKYNHFIYNIQYVDTFPLGKFEPFKTELL